MRNRGGELLSQEADTVENFASNARPLRQPLLNGRPIVNAAVQAGDGFCLMYVTGRSRLTSYLVCPQELNASATASPTRA